MKKSNVSSENLRLFSLCIMGLGIILLFISIISLEDSSWFFGGSYAFSLGIAVLAISLSVKSSEQIKSTANVDFLLVVNMLEDARAYFIGGIYKPDLFGWKTKNCIEMAIEVLKRDVDCQFIEEKYQDKLFHYFNTSFEHLIIYSNWEKETSALNNFTEAYAMLEDHYDTKHKTEFDNFFNKYEKFKDHEKEFFQQVKKYKSDLSK